MPPATTPRIANREVLYYTCAYRARGSLSLFCMSNPLFPSNTNDDNSYLLSKKDSSLQPAGADQAANIIRQKLEKIYANEPSVKDEIKEVENTPKPSSKHQQFMQKLIASGKSLAEIQTEWHNYYLGLPNNEKHQVWQEFYENAGSTRYMQHLSKTKSESSKPQTSPGDAAVSRSFEIANPPTQDERSRATIKKQVLDKVSAGGKLKAKHHLQSLIFGLGVGFLVLFIFLFGFFNEVFLAPFIHPNNHANATPVIIGTDTVSASAKDEIVIPKINVEIPVDYNQTSTNEATIENALEDGVVHYPTTVNPGQLGNAAFFGHSSNNIFNQGKYKFAFVLLHTLVPGDTFYLIKSHKVYAYKVISRKIVNPSDVSVLSDIPGQTATATLITCDPPGTSLHRLIVVGKQISPDPSKNTKSTNTSAVLDNGSTKLPGNGPTLLGRFFNWLF